MPYGEEPAKDQGPLQIETKVVVDTPGAPPGQGLA